MPAATDERTARVARWAAAGVLILSVLALLVQGANTTKRPSLSGAHPSRVRGFDQIAFEVRSSEGTTRHFCGLLALTAAQQDQGLMNRTDLAGYDGMLFQFGQPTTVEFYMKDTLIPLSIAWFDASGHFVSSTDMTPCRTQDSCQLYAAASPYTDALEVSVGGLGRLGIGTGSSLTVGGGC
ncbi:MAG: DUF192 domain-containing protein [Acidimicrobiales bacterium]